MKLAGRAAFAFFLLSTPALAIQDVTQPATVPSPTEPTAPIETPNQTEAPIVHPCGHMAIKPDGTFTPPPEVDPDTLDSARAAIMLFPLDAILRQFQDKMSGDVEKRLAATNDPKQHDSLTKLKDDLPKIFVVFKTDVVDLVSSGIACHQTKADLDALSAFIRTSAGQKLITSAAAHDTKAPDLTPDETASAYTYMTSDAGKRAFAEFNTGSETDNWMKAEMPLVAKQLVDWLKTTYGLEHFGDSL